MKPEFINATLSENRLAERPSFVPSSPLISTRVIQSRSLPDRQIWSGPAPLTGFIWPVTRPLPLNPLQKSEAHGRRATQLEPGSRYRVPVGSARRLSFSRLSFNGEPIIVILNVILSRSTTATLKYKQYCFKKR